jgi:ABC-type glycerol-3-phosphate transport system permease component
VVTAIAVRQIIPVSLSAYALARLRFWGAEAAFVVFTVQIMLPLEVIVVFLIFQRRILNNFLESAFKG